MKLVKTSLSDAAIRMRLADDADPIKATQWIEFQVPLKPLALPSPSGDFALGDPLKRYFGSIQQAALRYARDVLGAETHRLADHVKP